MKNREDHILRDLIGNLLEEASFKRMPVSKSIVRSLVREMLNEADERYDLPYIGHDSFKLLKFGIEGGGGFVDNYYIAAAALALEANDAERVLRFILVSHPYLAKAAREAEGQSWGVRLTPEQQAVLEEDVRIRKSFIRNTGPLGPDAAGRFAELRAAMRRGVTPSVAVTPDEDLAIRKFLRDEGYDKESDRTITRSVNPMTGKTETDRNFITGLNRKLVYQSLVLPLDVKPSEVYLYVTGNKDQIPESRRDRISKYLDDFLFTVGFLPPASGPAFITQIVKLCLEDRWEELRDLLSFGILLAAGVGVLARLLPTAPAAESILQLGKLTADERARAVDALADVRAAIKAQGLETPNVVKACGAVDSAINTGSDIKIGETIMSSPNKEDTAEIIKNIWQVTVEKPVVSQGEQRSGLDWLLKLDSGLPKRLARMPEPPGGRTPARVLAEIEAESQIIVHNSNLPNDANYLKNLIPRPGDPGFDPIAWEARVQSLIPAAESALARAGNVMGSDQFRKSAARLYGRIGANVTIKPVVANHTFVTGRIDDVLDAARKITSVDIDNETLSARVIVLDAIEGSKVLEDLLVPTSGVSSDTITIVPVTNSAGMDSMPTAWMIMHAIFDNAFGVLETRTGMNATRQVVDRLKASYAKLDELAKLMDNDPERYKINNDDPRAINYVFRPEDIFGTTIDSLWSRNAREIYKAELIRLKQDQLRILNTGDMLTNRTIKAPAVGQTITADRILTTPIGTELKGTKQGVKTLRSYFRRPMTDHIAELMSSAVGKEKGFVPVFDHIPDDYPYKGEIIRIAKEMEEILGPNGENAKKALAEDLKGMVLFVFPD